MKQKISETLEIPNGISCEFSGRILNCKKGPVTLSRKIDSPNLDLKIAGSSVVLEALAGNKNELKMIKSLAAHIRNMFHGVCEKFVYKLQACNVHFPMTLKVDGKNLVITNFLGEKTPRKAAILPNVDVDIKGQIITVSSNDKESAGHTAANFEKATKVRNRDRRIFQDGIFMIEKNGRAI